LLGRILVGNTLDASVSGDGDATFEEDGISALSVVLVSGWETVLGAGLQWKNGMTSLLEDREERLLTSGFWGRSLGRLG
jgi:hypothetical protein